MLKIKEIKQLIFQLTLIIVLLISFKHIFVNLQSNSKQSKKTKKYNAINKSNIIIGKKELVQNEEKLNKLRVIEKINSYIEEQAYLFLSLEENNINNKEILKSIEKNLLEIEKEANNKQVSKLINGQKIKDLKENIKKFEQILTQREC